MQSSQNRPCARLRTDRLPIFCGCCLFLPCNARPANITAGRFENRFSPSCSEKRLSRYRNTSAAAARRGQEQESPAFFVRWSDAEEPPTRFYGTDIWLFFPGPCFGGKADGQLQTLSCQDRGRADSTEWAILILSAFSRMSPGSQNRRSISCILVTSS